MHVDLTSDCLNACTGDATCAAFETLPPNGDSNQSNYLLKHSLRSFQTATGTTTFIKLGQNDSCTAGINGGGDAGLFTREYEDVGIATA